MREPAIDSGLILPSHLNAFVTDIVRCRPTVAPTLLSQNTDPMMSILQRNTSSANDYVEEPLSYAPPLSPYVR
ncbi:hypothetical protein O1611_g6757 [Lasiodiplodia mahajangana]|uniref:Uncharacterized protein n=1 Tax=Lasiodiplodia mahajangana TaxID=1108764 RepID=A0ACC2JHV9_9PEZI|nr:hypothetical protein O1611_g6757 [Lasiodiplodia mahajangana]